MWGTMANYSNYFVAINIEKQKKYINKNKNKN